MSMGVADGVIEKRVAEMRRIISRRNEAIRLSLEIADEESWKGTPGVYCCREDAIKVLAAEIRRLREVPSMGVWRT